LITTWLDATLTDMEAYARLGGSARRTHNTPLAIGQEYFWPEARGVVWDLRQFHAGTGPISPLDFNAPIKTGFDLDFVARELGDWPDRELVDMVQHGAQFKADVELQIVLSPHLVSLAVGFTNVDKGIQKLRDIGCSRPSPACRFSRAVVCRKARWGASTIRST
jgi:hypothetical protein